MSSRLLFAIILLVICTNSYAQNDKEVIHIEPIELHPLVEEYVDRRYIPPVAKKNIFFKLENEETIQGEVYFYCPAMDTPDFSYGDNLGSHNNLVGGFSFADNNKGYAQIPLKEFEEQEILIKISGYELLRINAENLVMDTTLYVRVTPKRTNQYIFLNKQGGAQHIVIEEVNNPQYFYGDCRPIYMKDGSHVDVMCGCWGCDPFLREDLLKDELKGQSALLKKIYKDVKKGKAYSLLIDFESEGRTYKITSVQEEYPKKRKYDRLLADIQQKNWLINTNNSNIKQGHIRLIFKAIKEK